MGEKYNPWEFLLSGMGNTRSHPEMFLIEAEETSTFLKENED